MSRRADTAASVLGAMPLNATAEELRSGAVRYLVVPKLRCRSFKALAAHVLCINICPLLWLEDSARAGRFLPCDAPESGCFAQRVSMFHGKRVCMSTEFRREHGEVLGARRR